MKYKKTCDLVETVLKENPEAVKNIHYSYDPETLLPDEQTESDEMRYLLRFSSFAGDLMIYKEWNDVYLGYSTIWTFRNEYDFLFRLTYKKEGDELVFVPGLSEHYSDLSKSNDVLLKAINLIRIEKNLKEIFYQYKNNGRL